ncbi:hypothetical protein HPB58_15220 [Priestia filamentosa]|nr:hypothetical protein [Priestia filamentosa]UOE58685.1 hypothetical protein HPB58_15220 [Priestia filamentosa]
MKLFKALKHVNPSKDERVVEISLLYDTPYKISLKDGIIIWRESESR